MLKHLLESVLSILLYIIKNTGDAKASLYLLHMTISSSPVVGRRPIVIYWADLNAQI